VTSIPLTPGERRLMMLMRFFAVLFAAGGLIFLLRPYGTVADLDRVGVAIGLALAFVFAQSVAAFLFGVTPRDPVTFASVSAVLVLTAMVACAVPALRAVRVDPVEAFRNE